MRAGAMITGPLSELARRMSADSQRDKLHRAARRFASLAPFTTSDGVEQHMQPGAHADRAVVRTKLLVQSGLHRGAQLDLVAGQYTIGSVDDCDIVLRDAGVASRQCRLTRGAQGFAMFDAGEAASQPIPPRSVRRTGKETRTSYDVGGVDIELLQSQPHATGSTSGTAQHLTLRPLIAAAVGGLALTILAMAATHLLAARDGETLAARIASGTKALIAQGFDAVRLRQEANGELVVTGLVSDAAEQKRLRAWLADSEYGDAHFTVEQAGALVDQVRDALAPEKLLIGFHEGRLRIEGATARFDVKHRIQELAEELRGVVDLEDRVAYVDARVVSPGPLPVRIRDVMIGSPSYFRTESGERYFEGAVLPDGAEVLAIEPSQIRFRLAERIVIYPLEG